MIGQFQLWCKERYYLHRIGAPSGYVWTMIGFFNSIKDAEVTYNNRVNEVDGNGHQEYVIEQMKIIQVRIVAGSINPEATRIKKDQAGA